MRDGTLAAAGKFLAEGVANNKVYIVCGESKLFRSREYQHMLLSQM
jgi:hypothetical protein